MQAATALPRSSCASVSQPQSQAASEPELNSVQQAILDQLLDKPQRGKPRARPRTVIPLNRMRQIAKATGRLAHIFEPQLSIGPNHQIAATVEVVAFIKHRTGFAKWSYKARVVLDEAYLLTHNWYERPTATLGEVAEAEALRTAFRGELEKYRLADEPPLAVKHPKLPDQIRELVAAV